MASAGIGRRVEGIHAVAAALAAGRVTRLHVEDRRRRLLGDLLADAAAAGIPTDVVDDVGAIAESSTPQGLVADCRPLPTVDLDHFAAEDRPAVLVVDHVQDPHNLGAIARSALAAGMTGLVAPAERAAPFSAVAFKAAAGALERLPVAVVHSVADALARLSDRGLWVVGLDAGSGTSLFGLDLLTEPVAVVVGAEGSGLGRLVGDRCDVVVGIPMAGPTESLNASVAAALAAFEVQRVRRPGG
ncbi:MAG: 23S rRNA (guanosine(2251)-2'-O)-methyltransferase RlmB [Acidimicrobiia bacterium]